MIIIDYNAIAIANIVIQKLEIKEDLIRHMILNSIRMYNQKFKDKYGQVVIANDTSSWRKDIFPQYKYKRREGREESHIDWDEAFRIINQVFEDLGDHFPYITIRVQKCEADDIIGALVEHTQQLGCHEEVMIVSADKDFIQLQRYNNVRQFSPMTKKFVEDKNPIGYLTNHILKGDAGDGVPNILSPDNTFVDGIRQSPVTQKKASAITDLIMDATISKEQELYRNYMRNKTLVDLSETPGYLKNEAINKYLNHELAHPSKVLNYLVKNRCKLLIECAGEFL